MVYHGAGLVTGQNPLYGAEYDKPEHNEKLKISPQSLLDTEQL